MLSAEDISFSFVLLEVNKNKGLDFSSPPFSCNKGALYMILLLTSSWTGTADDLVYIFEQRGIHFFRFNTDMYDQYQFFWKNDEFEIIDPLGRVCNSHDVSICVMYKCVLWAPHMRQKFDKVKDPLYVTYILNELCGCIANWALERKLLRLWHPTEYIYPKRVRWKSRKNISPYLNFPFIGDFLCPPKGCFVTKPRILSP